MGSAVSGGCCSGREDEEAKRRAYDKLNRGDGVNDDITRFDLAYDKNDIEEFVKLLSSTQPIDKLDEPMHPWAADPKTVGALAATQLAILAARDSQPELKDVIRKKGGIQGLLELLKSKEEDRIDGAVVALSFLSVNNAECCSTMFECGVLPYLVKCMSSEIDGLRAASAQTARNIFILGISQRKEFMRLGGIQILVNLLTPPNKDVDKPESWYTPLEAIYHIEDLIIDQNEELLEYTRAVRKCGVVDKLKVLTKSSNRDVSEAAEILLTRVSE
ncbi:ARM repeats containing [Cryptosporidium xiaoi]|uniref:ARM repeats containing n=1 Tax=Cryptosporidium xiaoi TaxID=659607 RepID=A0AAV9XW39_9CRYT